MRALEVILLLPSLTIGSFAQHTAPQDGFWETADGHGGAVGVFVSSLGHPYTTLGIYQRKGPEIQCMEENFFTTDPKYLGSDLQNVVVYNGSHLRLHFKPTRVGDLAFDIELTHDPATNIWSGDFHRGTFQRYVMLERIDRQDNQGGCFSPRVPNTK